MSIQNTRHGIQTTSVVLQQNSQLGCRDIGRLTREDGRAGMTDMRNQAFMRIPHRNLTTYLGREPEATTPTIVRGL